MAEITHKIRFTASAQDAIAEIQKYEGNIVAVSRTVDSMADKLGGGKLLQAAHNWTAAVDKVGGVTKLTEAEQRRINAALDEAIKKYDALGKEAPEDMRKLYEATKKVDDASEKTASKASFMGDAMKLAVATFSVGAITAFGKTLLDTADGLSKMSDKTGIGTEALQYLGAAATQGGNTLDEVAAAVSKMQVSIGGEDVGMARALKALGLTFDQLRAMRPEDQFTTLASAIQKVEDPADQAKLRVLAFGEAGNQLAGTLGQDFASIKDSVTVMSDGTVKSLDAVGDSLAQMTADITNTLANWLVAVHGWLRKVTDGITVMWMSVGVAWNEQMERLSLSMSKFLPVGSDMWKKLRKEAADFHNEARLGEQTLEIYMQKLDAEEAAFKKVGTAARATSAAHLNLGAETAKAAKAVDVLGDTFRKGQYAATEERLKAAAQAAAVADAQFGKMAGSLRESIPLWQQIKDAIQGVPELLEDIPNGVPEKLKRPAEEAIPFWKEHEKSIGQVGTAFDGLSRVAEMSGNKTMASVAAIASTTAKAFAAGGPWAAAMAFASSTFAAIGNKLFKTEERGVNDTRDAFVAAAGGIGALDAKAHAAGLELDRLLKAKTVKDYEAAVAELEAAFAKQGQAATDAATKAEKAVADQMAALEKYGLTWKDAGKEMQAATMTDTVKLLQADLAALMGAGVSWEAAVKAMGPAFSSMFADAAASGIALPAELQPVLDYLREAGLLADGTGAKVDALNDKFKAQADKVEAEYKSKIDAVKGSMKALDDELANLNASEAPEEVMGVVEAATRARIAEEQKIAAKKLEDLETQKKLELTKISDTKDEENKKLKETAKGFDVLFKDVVSSSADAAAKVRDAWKKAPWADWTPPDGRPSETPSGGMSGGLSGSLAVPSWMQGRRPAPSAASSSASSGRPLQITVISQIDKRAVGRSVINILPSQLSQMGY